MSANKPPPSRRVVILARVVLVLVSWAGAEGVLTFGGYPQWWAMDSDWTGVGVQYECDPDLGWKAQPGQFDLVWRGTQHVFHDTNLSGGRRATSLADTGAPQPARSQRVMFFGDSFIQGYGLSDGDTLPWIVQARHPEAEVSNYGAGNYGTYQTYLAMQKHVDGPAQVFYLFNTFHEDRNAANPAWLRVLKRPPQGCFFPYAVLKDGKLEAHGSRGDLMWSLSRHSRVVAMANEYVQILESYSRVHNKRALTMDLLARMDALVRSQGGKFRVILLDLDEPDRQVYRAYLDSRGIGYVDADHPERLDTSLRLEDGHPAGGLNRLIAKWIEPLTPQDLAQGRP